MDRKIRIGVLFGGKSAEHEISLLSARNVVESLDKEKYEVTLIGIDKDGHWCLCDEADYLLHHENPKLVKMHGIRDNVSLVPQKKEPHLVSLTQKNTAKPLDVIFPVLHGTYAEDGTVQGLLKLADIPFVGASVLGSAVGMDKDAMKRLLRDAGIPIAKFRTIHRRELKNIDFDEIVQELRLPLFVKPANLGSSVGVSKVKQRGDWQSALEHAFEYDHKILVEEMIVGKEIECAVLGNDDAIASLPGEVLSNFEFYTYDAKYLENGADFIIPARVSEETILRIQELCIKSYHTLYCEGLARIDLFVKENGEIIINEINTIPGFTKTSACPKLWQASGLPFPQFLDKLIELALERKQKERQLKTTFG